jgi:hypothetical protein
MLGTCGLLISFVGTLYGLCGDGPVADRSAEPLDVHDVMVAETFDDLAPLEAAALVGVLHEYRVVRRGDPAGVVEPLEVHAAVGLVARVAGLRPAHLHRLYRGHWLELRGTTAPPLVASLECHRLVARLVPVCGQP